MRPLPTTAATLALLLAACGDDGTTAPPDVLGGDEAADLAVFLSGQGYEGTSAEMASRLSSGTGEGVVATTSEPVPFEKDFRRAARCPLGGGVVVRGTLSGERDPDTRSGTLDVRAAKRHDACAFAVREGEVRITLDGAPRLLLRAHLARENGEPVGVQRMALGGGLAWSTDDGREGVCEVDLAASFDPDSGEQRVTGDFCGRRISVRRAWAIGS